MQITKGQTVAFESGEKYIVLETLTEEEVVYYCLLTEDKSTVVFCVEKLHPDGKYEYIPVLEEEKTNLLAKKFDSILKESNKTEGI